MEYILYITYIIIIMIYIYTHDMFVFSTVTKQGVLEGNVDTLANERFKA